MPIATLPIPRIVVHAMTAGIPLLFAIGSAHAGLNDPISFSQAGTVTLTLEESSGGFDHILELSSVPGAIGTPLMALTEFSNPSPDVLGYTPASAGDTVNLGAFGAGAELIFRLTNVESSRLGTPGTVADQVFSGSASVNNPQPGNFYTYVDVIDANHIAVYFEDAFPIAFNDPTPVATFLSEGYDAKFTLTLSPVPEPGTYAMMLAGLGLLSLGKLRSGVGRNRG